MKIEDSTPDSVVLVAQYFLLREPVKNYLADFFRQGGLPPSLRFLAFGCFLADFFLIHNHCAQKPFSGIGGYQPLNGKNPLNCF